MARTKSTTKAPTKRKTTSTTTAPRKPGRPKKDRRPVVTVQLSAEKLRGMSAGKLAEFLAEQHPSSTIELHSEGAGRVELERDLNAAFNESLSRSVASMQATAAATSECLRATEAAHATQAELTAKTMAGPATPVKFSRIELLMEELHRSADDLHMAISAHGGRIDPILQEVSDEASSPEPTPHQQRDSQLATSIINATTGIRQAIRRIEDMTARAQV